MTDYWATVTVGDIPDIKGDKRLPKGEEFAKTTTPFPYISDARYMEKATQTVFAQAEFLCRDWAE